MKPIRPEFVDLPTAAARAPDENDPASANSPWRAVAESLLVFLVIFIHGASLPPDLNEAHYLGKAKHYWQPTWCPGDFFLDSADAHLVFYWSFGWLTRVYSLPVVAWIGRIATWLLLAFAWRRLSWAVAPKPWLSVLSAIVFLAAMQRCHMAGEWVVGGVEAKGFAYALVFFALGSLAKGGWRSAIVLCGAATAFHVLAGGWALVAIGMAWLVAARERPSFLSLIPAGLAAAVLAMPGVVSAALLNRGIDAETVAQANAIYVYDRLKHHLVLQGMQPMFLVRFVVLCAIVGALVYLTWRDRRARLVSGFALGALAIALVGAVLSGVSIYQPDAVAGALRLYWFRLADVAIPLAAALLLCARLAAAHPGAPLGWATAIVTVGCVLHLSDVLYSHRPDGEYWKSSPADAKNKIVRDDQAFVESDDWRQICRFFVDHPGISPAAKVLTPRNAHTFKWYAAHPEVGNWKDIPQDAASIVTWMEQMKDIHVNRDPAEPDRRWSRTLAEKGTDEVERLARKYQASYVVTEAEPPLQLPRLYANKSYAVYAIPWERPK